MIVDEKEVWVRFMCAALSRGETNTEHAAKLATNALKVFREHHDTIGQWERERAWLFERVEAMDRQRQIGTYALQLLQMILRDVKEGRGLTDGWKFEAERVVRQLLCFQNKTYVIVPEEKKPPTSDEDGESNPLLWSPPIR